MRVKSVSRFDWSVLRIGCVVVCLYLTGCITTIEKTYKAPEAKGSLFYFYPESSDQFTPISGAKIYHQDHPETAVYSDEQGDFILPPVIKIEFKLLMIGHAFKYYPIVIEKGDSSFMVLARASLHMRQLESIDFRSIILAQPNYSTAGSVNKSIKSQWPCDQDAIRILDQSVTTFQRLSAALNDGLLDSSNEYSRLVQHATQLGDLQNFASGSCHWQEFNDEVQREKIRQTEEYFSGIQKILENSPAYLESLNINNNSFYNE